MDHWTPNRPDRFQNPFHVWASQDSPASPPADQSRTPMLWGEWRRLRSRLKAARLTGRLNTAFIERLNLMLRQGVALLTRRTWGTAQHMSELALHVEWWRTYYHFARYHESLRIKLASPRPRKGKQLTCRYRSQTPAMAAGIATHRWTVLEIISYPLR